MDCGSGGGGGGVCVCGGMLKSGSQQITEPYRAAPSYHDLGQQFFFPILLVCLDLRGFFFSPFFFFRTCGTEILVYSCSYYFIYSL